MQSKECSSCNLIKGYKLFNNDASQEDGKATTCKNCMVKERKKGVPEGCYDVDADYGFLNRMEITKEESKVQSEYIKTPKRK